MAAIHTVDATLLAPNGSTILAGITWDVAADERWAVIGANGSGKTSLLRLAGAQVRPSSGTVEVLGRRLGRTDLRVLRRRIGVASAAVGEQIRPGLSAHEAVVTGRFADLEPWWHDYDDADHARADELLDLMGCRPFRGRPLATLSQGERQRVMLARALMPQPEMLLLDEPAAGLDLPGREALVDRISSLAADPHAPPLILVTHHVEEIPPAITHALVLRAGHVVAAGPAHETLRAEVLSDAFGMRVELARRDGRWAAWARH